MVCRENKGRSAQMGIVKALQRMHNGDAFNDAEIQSLIHQVKHDGDALDAEMPLSTEEQIDMMRHTRSAIEKSGKFPPNELYRESKQRPGIITRINQEIARLESGKAENGKELTAAQKNSHSHIYAMQRLGQSLERVQPAKEQFLETNARHRGISYDEAKAEWNALMNREGHFEAKSKVRDDLRTSLATAGVDNHAQANLGVSGRAIDAMEIMEQRRLDAVASMEHRPAASEEHSLAKFVDKNSAQAQKKCSICGQFGHDDSECPNIKHVATLRKISSDRTYLNQARELLDREELATHGTDEEITVAYNTDDPDQWRKDSLAAVEQAKDNGDYMDPALHAKQARRIEVEQTRAEEKIAASELLVSDTVDDVRYNEDTGVLVIHRHNDEEGNPQAPIIRRCRPQEAADFVDRVRTEPLDNVLASSLNEDRHTFANRGDAEAALTMTRCPTCGQWASMNSGHQCPVPGGPSEELEHERRRRRMEEQRARRERRAEGGEDVNVLTRSEMFSSYRHNRYDIPVTVNGKRAAVTVNSMRYAKSREVSEAVANGNVATPSVEFTFSDGKVTGKASVWATDDGTPVISAHDTGMSGTGLKCDCDVYKAHGNCKHLHATKTHLSRAYGPTNAPLRHVRDGVLPGENPRITDRIAPDALELNDDRVGTARLLAIKNSRREAEMAKYVSNRADGQGATSLMVDGPKDAEGADIDWPDTWSPQETDDDGDPRRAQSLNKVTDLHNDSEVADRFRLLLSNRTATMRDGTTERMKFAANRTTNPGGITINIPRKYAKASPGRRRDAQRALAETLDLPVGAVTDKGVFIPKDTATYAEYLERAARNTNTARFRGPRTYVASTPEDIDRSRRGSRLGWDGQTPTV
ncbi:MAG TPA: hypothetical protein VFC72_04190 [Corynebacterium sp.]|nr:hypothetical protein [Corynebacterium sp.]